MQTDMLTLAQRHYENFPVGSLLLPKEARKALHLYYAFARTADDVADEGSMTPDERLSTLTELQGMLHASLAGNPPDPYFTLLADSIRRHGIDPQLFDRLITAFRQDTGNPLYATLEELEGYCRNSAHPVGEMVLQLFGSRSAETVRLSDHICSALQLTNFWQDISVDTVRNRFYIPTAAMTRFGVGYEDLRTGQHTEQFRAMMQELVRETRERFYQGKDLLRIVPRGLRLELRLIYHGGLRILERIERMDHDTRRSRPVLGPRDMAVILLRALKT